MNIQTIKNVKDCVPLYLPHSLYLKPVATLNVSVALPSAIMGKTISNWEVMDKLRNLILPDTFSVLRVVKSTVEFIRLEAEIEERSQLKPVLARLDGTTLKLNGFSEAFRVRASESKDDFPTRHDWDSFFRDARNMDEMKAGERPDTIYVSNLPIVWFCPRHMENADHPKPSESIFKRIFEKFGNVRVVDIPICDPYRNEMKPALSGLKNFSFDNETYFEGYIQFDEYLGFVRAMDAFRGMKLVRKEGEKSLAVNIVVDFDKTKHLSDASTKRRKVARDRLIAKEKAQEEEERKKQEAEELKRKKAEEKLEELKRLESEKQKQREERRKGKQLKKIQQKESVDFGKKIRAEEKKLMAAQRKLESIRLLDALFERVRVKAKEVNEKSIKSERISLNKDKRSGVDGADGKSKSKPLDLRDKLIAKYRSAHESEYQKRQEKLKKVREGKSMLTDLLGGNKERSPSIDTISSNDSIFSDSNAGTTSKKSKKKKKKKARSSSSSSTSSSSSSKNKQANSVPKNDSTALPNIPTMYPQPHYPGPMYNAEEWMGMGVYPSYVPPFFAGAPVMRPNFYPDGGYNYRGNFRGRFPRGGRGRGGFNRNRGNGTFNNYDNDPYYRYFNKKAGYDDSTDDYKRRSRSKSRTRSHSRSRSRSRSDRRRSRRRSRSDSRSPRRHTSSKFSRHSRKLASTLRNRDSSTSSPSSSEWSRRSRSRRRSDSRSWSRSRSKSRSAPGSRSRSRAKEDPVSIQPTTPPPPSMNPSEGENKVESETKKRSHSVDSSKFISPKRRERSQTPDLLK